MDYLARSISIAKWDEREYVSGGEVRADSLICLRTRDDGLSFWVCDGDQESSIKEVILAQAAGKDRAETLQLVMVSRASVEGEGIELRQTPGITPIETLRDKHVDAVQLTGTDLLKIAHLIARTLRSEESERWYHRITRNEVLEILQAAVDDGRVQITELASKIQEELSGSSTSAT